MRLSQTSLANIAGGVELPGYDRDRLGVGIVHFGIGAFHRAHQAWYTDRVLDLGSSRDKNWLITGVSMRSAEVAAQINPQDGLYTIAERSAAGTALRVIGAVREVMIAAGQRPDIEALLAAPATKMVTFTVTEKGYCRQADGSLDLALADRGFYSILAEAFGRRKAAGLPGLTLLSCDNLADNGKQLRQLLAAYIQTRRPDIGDWFERECTCPATMVDRIVPATTEADRVQLTDRTGLRDEGLVLTEPFSQWVIEDRFVGDRPAWDRVGAQIVSDVTPFETAKLRMLNGAHSALAYLGLGAGHSFVHEAMADSTLRPVIESLMRDEAATSFDPAPGQDPIAYADALLARFENPALNHRLIQIAMDGSQKVPQRWLATLEAQRLKGRACPAILQGMAAWMRHLRGANEAKWGQVDDPMAARLRAAGEGCDATGFARALFGEDGLLAGTWRAGDSELATLGTLAAA